MSTQERFRNWLQSNSSNIEEMATMNFGKHKGIDHTEVDPGYLQWMQKQIAAGKARGFNVTDQGRRLGNDELNDLIQQHLTAGGGTTPNVTQRAQQQPAQPRAPLATVDAPEGDVVITFGKHNGKTIQAVAQEDAGYLRWMLGKIAESGRGFNLINDQGRRLSPEEQQAVLTQNLGGGDVEDHIPEQDAEIGQDGSRSKRPQPEEVRLPAEHMTPYNQNIQDKFLNTNEDIMIDALAGTGKTTMLKHLASFIKPGEKWLYLVFNTKNRDEATQEFPVGRDEQGRVVSTVTVKTTHGFLGNLLNGVSPELGGNTKLPKKGQSDKINIIADNLIPKQWPESPFENKRGNSPFYGRAKFKAIGLANLAKAYAIQPDDPQITEKLTKIVEDYNIDMDCSLSSGPPEWQSLSDETVQEMTKQIIDKAAELLKSTLPGTVPQDGKLAWLNDLRDQDDTLWYTAIYADQMNWRTGHDVVLMDEVQDFNMCQMIMAKKLKEAGARVIAVGDPNQSMYRFRGADSDAFNNLKQVIGNGESDSLPINFRSGGNIIDWVRNNTDVKDLQAAPHLEGQGEVWADGGTHPPVGYEDFMSMAIGEVQNGGQLAHGTAMIARNNAPLAVAAMGFLKSGVDFEIVGLDLSKDLVDLIEETIQNIRDENPEMAFSPESQKSQPVFVNWEQRKGRGGRTYNTAVPNFTQLPLEQFAQGFLPAYIQSRSAMWRHSASKRDKLKKMRSTASVLNYIWMHIQDPNSIDEEAKAIAGGSVLDLVNYLKKKLGGTDPENPQAMKKLSAKDPNSYVTLTTAHKSKGLEWDRIFLMQPGAYDPEGEQIRTEADAQQEKNSWYVAATRGKKVLMVSSDEEPKASSGDDDADDGEDLSTMFKMMLKR